MNLQPEADFFKDIATKISALVLGFNGKAAVAQYKKIGDYATEIDIAVENLIIAQLQKKIPTDSILAEEGRSNEAILNSRIWVIDPICGTANSTLSSSRSGKEFWCHH